MTRVIVFAERMGWHNRQLADALAAHELDTHTVPLGGCAIVTGGDDSDGLQLPDLDRVRPDAAVVRAVPGGSFEQVTFYLSLLHALSESGVPVINQPRAIERTVDKGMTSLLLHRAGVPTPPTWVCVDHDHARAVAQAELVQGFELVRKPLFGSQGEGLRRITCLQDLTIVAHDSDYSGVYYLQRFIHPGSAGWHDWRVFVVGGSAVAAMRREGVSWINNMALGAQCHAAVLQPQLKKLAEAASRALALDYCGVDILRDPDDNWWVVEVNSIPAWRGLQSVAGISIAEQIARQVVARIPTRAADSAAAT